MPISTIRNYLQYASMLKDKKMLSLAPADLAILETKFQIYEDLSKKMIEKLEGAVDKIAESNTKMASILTIHDEKIGTAVENSAELSKRLEKIKDQINDDTKTLRDDIKDLSKELEAVNRFRWIIVGSVTLIAFMFSQAPLITRILTPGPTPVTIERSK